jgi:hypothetical protein
VLCLQSVFIKDGLSQVLVANSTSADGSYTTLKSAFDKINLFSQSGKNILITISGNTVESASAVLNESSSPWTSLKIIPSANATISGNISGPLITLNGADKVVINGINGANTLTLDNSSATNSAATIQFKNDASQNKITNCIIKGSSAGDNNSTTYGGVVWIYTGTTTGNDNDTISNCDIGPSGSNLPFMAIRGYGTTGKHNDGVVISDNTIHDFFCSTSITGTEGVYVGLYNNAWTIKGNKFYQSAARTYSITASEYRAIYITNTTTPGGGYIIDNNTIGYASATLTGSTTITGSSNMIRCIYIKTLSTAASSTISNNKIAAITQTTSRNGTTSTIVNSPFIGIAVDAAGPVTISNNIIGLTSGTASITVNHNYNSFAFGIVYVIGIFTSGASVHTISGNEIGAIKLNKSSNFGYVSFNGIKTEGNAAVSILDNKIGNSTAANISSNFTQGLLTGINISNSASGLIASGNTISNFSLTSTSTSGNAAEIVGIDVNSPSGTVTLSNNIISNLFYSMNPNADDVVTGIRSAEFTGAIYTITGNTISSLSSNYSSGFSYSYLYGMDFDHESSGNIISSNQIYGLYMDNTGYLYGINVNYAGCTFTNNMISVGYGIPTNKSIGCTGVFLQQTYNYPEYFYFNTIILGGTSSFANYTYALYGGALASGSTIINNIIINDRAVTGTNGLPDAAMWLSSLFGVTSDYNLLYVNPAVNYLIHSGSGSYTTLTAWKTTGKDVNSISSPLTFVDPQSDLHLISADCEIVSDKGTPVSGITLDIDGESRDPVNPDIGADECFLILPIELIAFSAEVIHHSSVLVSWTTASEVNNDYFEVERSKDAEIFEAIGIVAGSLFSDSHKEYQFEDTNPLQGISYYRLKQVDTDASITFSPWMVVEIADEQPIIFSPNPVNDNLTVSNIFFTNDENILISLYDITGRLVLTKLMHTSDAVLNVKSLSPGLYYLSAEYGSHIYNSKLVKQ